MTQPCTKTSIIQFSHQCIRRTDHGSAALTRAGAMARYPWRARKYNSNEPFLTSLVSNWRRQFNNVCAITRLSACSSSRHLQRSRPAFHPSPQQAVPGDGPQLFEIHHWAPGHYATSGPTRAFWGLGFGVWGLGFKLPDSGFGERGGQ